MSTGMQFDQYQELFHGPTDLGYLQGHYPRFIATKNMAYESWKWKQASILDVGAHWLHQSVLYALDGHHVTAADFADPLDHPATKQIASTHGIRRLVFEDLSSEHVFDELDEDSMDVVLFCEILEHITFNPVAMWKAIYRVLKPGGRIILTTPNCYSMANLVRSFPRFVSGRGFGITISDILNIPTHAHHWKEYSGNELRTYFETLSADFAITRLEYCSFRADTGHLNWKGRLLYDRANLIPVFRKGIYMEIDLPSKLYNISIQPDW